MKYLLFLAFTISFSSCGKLSGDSTGAFQTDENISTLIGGVESIQVGKQGYILSGRAVNAGRSGHNFELEFKLPENEKIKFLFFTNPKLEGGLEVEFKNISNKVFANFILNKKNHTFEIEDLAGQTEIRVSLDIHNDHTDIHALLWKLSGPFGDEDECSFDGNCLYNTEDFALDHWLGVGKAKGNHWGVRGNSKLLIKVKGFGRPISNI